MALWDMSSFVWFCFSEDRVFLSDDATVGVVIVTRWRAGEGAALY
jgi:hypothetical protein